MNWTGGRLQRHSLGNKTNARSLRAVQKQHFARVRLAARERRGPNLSPIKVCGSSYDAGHRDGSLGRDDEDRQIAGRAQMVEDKAQELQTGDEEGTRDRTGEDQRSGSISRGQRQRGDGEPDIESIRRKLLEQSDWANLSLTRPLKMKTSFVTAERDNLGKRRRLTENDRRRLNAAHQNGNQEGAYLHDSFARPPPRQARARGRSSSVFAPDEISIRIGEQDGRRWSAVSSTPTSQASTMQMLSQESEESMLFDGMEGHHVPPGGHDRRYLVEYSATPKRRGRHGSESLIQVEVSSAREGERERDIEEQEQLTESPSYRSNIPLPTLDPRGSFTTENGETRYNAPDAGKPSSSAITSSRGKISTESLTTLTSSPRTLIHPIQRPVPLWVPEAPSKYPGERYDAWKYTASKRQHGLRTGEYQLSKPEGYLTTSKESVEARQLWDHGMGINGNNRARSRSDRYQGEYAPLSGFAVARNQEADASRHERRQERAAWENLQVLENSAYSMEASRNAFPASYPASAALKDGVLQSTAAVEPRFLGQAGDMTVMERDEDQDAIWRWFVFGR